MNLGETIEYLYAGVKVACDKVYDCATYVQQSDDEESSSSLSPDNPNTLDLSKYNDEHTSKRLFNKINLFDEYNIFFSEPTHIIDNIYLGSAFNAATYSTLQKNKIKTIINVTQEISQYYPDYFTYAQYKIYDDNKNTIDQYLEEVYNYILDQQKQLAADENIFIHCYMGASRSASVVIYYLMKNKKYTFDQALNFIKDKRAVVNPTFRLAKDLAKSIVISNNKDKKIN